jgi:hypothetical protein
MTCDVLIVGGGTGGVAAALAVTSLGYRAILTEETDWIGGQLTSQAVPPDEHPWIEQFGCTRSYRTYRNLVRQFYRSHTDLTSEARRNPHLNPGGGRVSRLCHEPRIGWLVMNQMLHEAVSRGLLEIRLREIPIAADVQGDQVRSVTLRNLETGRETHISAPYILDATELGDLLPLTGTEYTIGAESRSETGERNAPEGPAQPENVQAITWVFAMAHEQGADHTIDKPASYDRWREFQPTFWPGPLIGEQDVNPITLQPRNVPFFDFDNFSFFTYRQIVEPSHFVSPRHPVTIVNWPMNDYFLGTIVDVDDQTRQARLEDSRQLSLSLLYWMQTELGMKGLYLRPDITGTDDGFAKTPYIRESRRIRARFTVTEKHVSAEDNPGRDRAVEFPDSVGIGAYRIDLHPSTGGDNYIDTSSLPFQIPLGALIPQRTRNLLPACKNLGVTHITNGCYRLHPVEWNIGESAGYLAAYCLQTGSQPAEVYEAQDRTREFQSLLRQQGIELEWPTLRAL